LASERKIDRLLVLGSTSFGGGCLVDLALNKGLTVFGASRSDEPHPVLRPYSDNANLARFRFDRIDLNHHLDRLLDLIDEHRPDAIVDFAGQGMVAPSWEAPEQWYQTNIVAKVRLHKALVERPFVQAYVRISTPEVYGDHDGRLTESAPLSPSTPYAVSHAAIDMSLMAFYRYYGMPVILTRFANFYGPGQQLYRIVPRTALCALGSGRLTLDGGGTSIRAFVHGRDVAAAVLAVLESGRLGQTYHFSTEEFVSIRELVETIAEFAGVAVPSFCSDGPERPGKDSAYVMDSGKARDELGWRPRTELMTGLKETFDWVAGSFDVLRSLPSQYVHRA